MEGMALVVVVVFIGLVLIWFGGGRILDEGSQIAVNSIIEQRRDQTIATTEKYKDKKAEDVKDLKDMKEYLKALDKLTL